MTLKGVREEGKLSLKSHVKNHFAELMARGRRQRELHIIKLIINAQNNDLKLTLLSMLINRFLVLRSLQPPYAAPEDSSTLSVSLIAAFQRL